MAATKKYIGSRTLSGRAIVLVQDTDGKPHNLSITPSLRIWRHSPDGFEWGYGGSGPAQLALALLFDHTHDKEISNQLHQQFKVDMIATLPRDGWTIDGAEIQNWITEWQTRQTKKDQQNESHKGA